MKSAMFIINIIVFGMSLIALVVLIGLAFEGKPYSKEAFCLLLLTIYSFFNFNTKL